MQVPTPDFLFHHTTIENLALILKNKTFRFTKLSNLNDPLEGKGYDLELAEDFVFSSSWTSSQRATIPMWKMYSGLEGVRLKLAKDPFSTVGNANYGEWGGANFTYATLSEPAVLETTNSKKWGHGRLETTTISGPDPITYLTEIIGVQHERLLYDLTCKNDPNSTFGKGVRLGPVGLFKSDDWGFEKEWRFRVLAWADLSLVNKEDYENHTEFLNQIRPVTQYVDIPLRDTALDKLEVELGPKTSAATEIIIQALLDKYAPNATVSKSKIQIE